MAVASPSCSTRASAAGAPRPSCVTTSDGQGGALSPVLRDAAEGLDEVAAVGEAHVAYPGLSAEEGQGERSRGVEAPRRVPHPARIGPTLRGNVPGQREGLLQRNIDDLLGRQPPQPVDFVAPDRPALGPPRRLAPPPQGDRFGRGLRQDGLPVMGIGRFGRGRRRDGGPDGGLDRRHDDGRRSWRRRRGLLRRARLRRNGDRCCDPDWRRPLRHRGDGKGRRLDGSGDGLGAAGLLRADLSPTTRSGSAATRATAVQASSRGATSATRGRTTIDSRIALRCVGSASSRTRSRARSLA